MNCLEKMEQLNAWVDGKAAEDEKLFIERHLDSCAGCRGQVRWLKAMKAALAGAPAPAIPGELKALLMREARGAARRKAARGLRRRLGAWLEPRPWAGLGLAAGLAAAAVALMLRASGGREEIVSVDDMLAAHRGYALTMPLANYETGLSGLAEALAGGRL